MERDALGEMKGLSPSAHQNLSRRRLLKALSAVLLLVILVLGIVAFGIFAPYGPRTETFVEIAPGTTASRIAEQMRRSRIIRSQYLFELVNLRKGGSLKAGEYRFDHVEPMTEVYRRVARGDVYTKTLAIPEGFNIFDVAHAVEAAGLGSADSFLDAEQKHTELISAWIPAGHPRPNSVEGFLFPDTYHFSRHATPEQMLTAMIRRFRQAAAQIPLEGDVYRGVTMASIIEKEVKQGGERPLVASVFENRLKRGMPLQTDPTVIYAALLEHRFRGTIYASDLGSVSAYNTYKHAGLPPGPICNPGIASIHAALSPATSDYLYFVSDASGRSRFSTTLKEHGMNVEAYREAQRLQAP